MASRCDWLRFKISDRPKFKIQEQKSRFARSRDRATFRRKITENRQTWIELVEGSRASALLSLRSSLSPVLAAANPWHTCPTPGISRGEPQRAEGKAATRAMPTTRARRLRSARSPSVAPKRHGVGRVARRARPAIACHCKAWCTPNPALP
jgi:hypothetical protein